MGMGWRKLRCLASVLCTVLTDSCLLILAELIRLSAVADGLVHEAGGRMKAGQTAARQQGKQASKSSWYISRGTPAHLRSVVRVLSGGQGRRVQQQGSWWL